MKKFLMAALMFCGVVSASAQSDLRFGVTGGMNVSNVTDLESDCRIGFNIGARLEYNFNKNVYFGTGLILSQKGMKEDYVDDDHVKVEAKGMPLYLQIPFQIGGRYHLGNGVSLFGETGPYMAFGVGGKLKSEAKAGKISVEEKVDYFGDDAAEVFDMGWGLRAGVEVSNFQIHMGYEYGFTKVFEDTSCHNSNFNVGVSYFF